MRGDAGFLMAAEIPPFDGLPTRCDRCRMCDYCKPMGSQARLSRRVAFVAVALFVFTDGPLFFVSKELLGRPGPSWEDEVVFAGLVGFAGLSTLLVLGDLWRSNRRWRYRPQPTGTHSDLKTQPTGTHSDLKTQPTGTHSDLKTQPTGTYNSFEAHSLGAVAVGGFTLLIVASTTWSVDALHTGWRSAVYVGLAMLAWLVADLADRVSVSLTAMAGAAVAASLTVVALAGDAGLDHNGDWQGIYLGRNLFAPVAAIGVIAGVRLWAAPIGARRGSHGSSSSTPSMASAPVRALHESPVVGSCPDTTQGHGTRTSGGRRYRLGGGLLIVASAVSMLAAGSRTAWLALLGGSWIATLPLWRIWLRRRLDARQTAASMWATVAVSVTLAAVASAVLWDTATFAQRRTIWRVSWEQFLERPLLGHGFSAVWTSPEFLDNHALLDRGSAHNAVLEVLLGLGAIGLAPFAVIVVLAVRNAGRDLLRSPSADTWMWACVVAVMLIENTTESFILRMSYNWVIVVAAALRTPREIDTSTPPTQEP